VKTSAKAKRSICFLYLRVSTARQAHEGVGLDAQEAKSRLHAERMGWEVLGVFKDEGISGKDGIENRPGLKALLAACKANSDAVAVVYSVSRLARRQRLLWQLLDEREGEGLKVSSATEAFDTTTPTGRAMLGMIAVFAQLEADMISERTRDALAEVKAQGKRLGQKPMKDLAPETVEMVKKLYASGNFTHRSLAEHLNQQNVPTPSGRGKWWPRNVEIAIKS
jgi:DNA invertase Pin-like site-specific DNA recombinase